MHSHSEKAVKKAQSAIASWIVKRVELLGGCRCCKAETGAIHWSPNVYTTSSDALGQYVHRFNSLKLICSTCGLTEDFSVNTFLLSTEMCPDLFYAAMRSLSIEHENRIAKIAAEDEARKADEQLKKAEQTPSSGLVN